MVHKLGDTFATFAHSPTELRLSSDPSTGDLSRCHNYVCGLQVLTTCEAHFSNCEGNYSIKKGCPPRI